MSKLIITIDGPAGSGKSTVAKALAEKLRITYLDTGAMYRAVTLAAMQKKIDLNDEQKILAMIESTAFEFSPDAGGTTVLINGKNVTELIRSELVTSNVYHIASKDKLRGKLVDMQRDFAVKEQKIITEGRDQGTVAFPDANFKFFLTADVAERARRRHAELFQKGSSSSIEQVQNEIEKRDLSDQTRTTGPLKPARDAIIIDTTKLTIKKVVKKLAKCIYTCIRGTKWYFFGVGCSKLFCRLAFRLKIFGKENIPKEGPFLLLGNHQSYFDPIFCGIYVKRPLCFLARDTLFKGLGGKIIASVNAIPVKRGQGDLNATRRVIERLKHQYGACIFPEATRTSDGKIAALKPGFGLLARKSYAAILPVVIDGAFEAWPKHKKMFIPWKKIIITYGTCISPEEVMQLTDEQLAQKVTSILRQMQTRCRLAQGKKPFDYNE